MKRVLILEGDLFILSTLSSHLKSKGYLVSCSQTVERAELLLLKNKFDLLICERTINGFDILYFLESIKERKLFMRVLVLSKKKSLIDRVAVLKIANDFLAKPFDLVELYLKIDNLLNLEKIDGSEFIENSLLLFRENEFLGNANKFRPQELKILECLFKHRNIVISYETISSYVWGYRDSFPLKKTISVYIRRIRSKLFLKNIKIVTIKNRGYKLIDSMEKNI